jgi:hypothetical protein
MGNAPDIPPEELNLTHMRTITALVGSMQRVQHEVDEIGRQFAASLFRLRSSFDLIDQLFHTAGEAAARLRDNLPKNWPHDGKLLNNVWRVLAEDGIPIVYVPRAEIVRAILEEDDFDSRIVRIRRRGRRWQTIHVHTTASGNCAETPGAGWRRPLSA